MNKPRTILVISATMMLMSVGATKSSAAEENGNWYDTYYQYRVPVMLEVKEAGWNAVPIDASTITAAINKNEELKFDPLWFAWNQLKIVEVDDHGRVSDSNVRGGFCLVPESDELLRRKLPARNRKLRSRRKKGPITWSDINHRAAANHRYSTTNRSSQLATRCGNTHI